MLATVQQEKARNLLRLLLVIMLLVPAAAGLAGCTAFHTDLAAHEARVAEGFRIAETDVGPIQYAERGAGDPVLVLHGSGGGFDQGMLVGRAMLGEGYRIIAPSRFGYLETPLLAEADADAQAEAHRALLDSLDVERTAVVGFSAGAPSALALARQWPERVSAVILIVPALGPTESMFGRFAMRFPFVFDLMAGTADFGYWAANQTSQQLVLHLIGVPPEVEAAAPAEQKEFAAKMLEWVLPADQRMAGVENDARTLWALGDLELADLNVPTLALCARDDRLVGCGPAERVAAAAPEAHLEAFDSGGHLLLGRHEAARAAIRSFLEATRW